MTAEMAFLRATRPDVGLDLEIVEESADRLALCDEDDENLQYVLSDLRAIIDNHSKRVHSDRLET